MEHTKHCFTVMGGPASIQIYFDTHRSSKVIALAESEARRLEAKYSRYQSNSFLSKIVIKYNIFKITNKQMKN